MIQKHEERDLSLLFSLNGIELLGELLDSESNTVLHVACELGKVHTHAHTYTCTSMLHFFKSISPTITKYNKID